MVGCKSISNTKRMYLNTSKDTTKLSEYIQFNVLSKKPRTIPNGAFLCLLINKHISLDLWQNQILYF